MTWGSARWKGLRNSGLCRVFGEAENVVLRLLLILTFCRETSAPHGKVLKKTLTRAKTPVSIVTYCTWFGVAVGHDDLNK